MKKLMLVALMMVGMFTLTFAQLRIGPKAGVTFSKQVFDDDNGLDIESENVQRITIGVALEVPITEEFAIQPEASFAQRGSKFEVIGVESEHLVDYIDLAAILKYKFGTEGIGFNVLAGPTYSLAIDGTDDDIDFGDEGTFDIKDTDFGVTVGAGVNFLLGESILFIDARYLLGFSDLNDNDDEIKINSRSYGLNAGILFAL